MGEEPVAADDRQPAIADFCREIEIYLCRKNDGHLIRVVGPSFDLVSGWAAQGVPLKVACAGIDRAFERYHRKGARRRPLKIDFCDADVLDAFDEWRRALGVTASANGSDAGAEAVSHSGSLPAHLERVVARLTAARASGGLDDGFDAIIDRASAELDAARAKAGGVRGEAREALLERLRAIDADLIDRARAALDQPTRAELSHEADLELNAWRAGMSGDAYARAHDAAVDRLVRERFKLPAVAYE